MVYFCAFLNCKNEKSMTAWDFSQLVYEQIHLNLKNLEARVW